MASIRMPIGYHFADSADVDVNSVLMLQALANAEHKRVRAAPHSSMALEAPQASFTRLRTVELRHATTENCHFLREVPTLREHGARCTGGCGLLE